MENNSKKIHGRRKMEMKKIESKKDLATDIHEAPKGSVGKGRGTGRITNLVQSPADKISSFGYPSAESVIHNYERAGTYFNYNPSEEDITDVKNGYFQAMKILEDKKRIESGLKKYPPERMECSGGMKRLRAWNCRNWRSMAKHWKSYGENDSQRDGGGQRFRETVGFGFNLSWVSMSEYGA
ncbi:uncharacterized protein LOC142520671 [Primulina tabacum]|uniref:uncharacterized protein LOC142520671 n=1 Tax=Primulina tabacum TaxID=48773 RepID=UPI003F598259